MNQGTLGYPVPSTDVEVEKSQRIIKKKRMKHSHTLQNQLLQANAHTSLAFALCDSLSTIKVSLRQNEIKWRKKREECIPFAVIILFCIISHFAFHSIFFCTPCPCSCLPFQLYRLFNFIWFLPFLFPLACLHNKHCVQK